jgi:hypothetical protein
MDVAHKKIKAGRPGETTARFFACVVAALFCGCTGEEANGGAPSLAPGEISLPAALVVTTDYNTGAYSAVRSSDHAVARNIDLIHQDATCRFDPVIGLPVVIARLGANAVDIIDPAKAWAVRTEYSVEAGGERTNPQDFAAFSQSRAYVSRFNASDLLVVHPIDGEVLETIDLSAYADADGIPEASWMLMLEKKLYLVLARLAEGKDPVDYSSLLVIDGASGEIEEEVRLSATNPFGRPRLDPVSGGVVLCESGDWDENDGGIEIFHPADNSLSGLLVTEEALGGDAVDAVLVSENKGYAIVGRPAESGSCTHLVSFDPSTGELVEELLAAERWDFASLELSPDGQQLWLGDRTRESSGIRIFDVNDDSEFTDEPIDVGLPPFAICFVP